MLHWLPIENRCSKTEFTFVHRQAFVLSLLTMLLQVWGKKIIFTVWCQNMLGRFGTNVDVGGEEEPTGGTYFQIMYVCSICCRGGPSRTWIGVWNRGYHCRQGAGVSYSTPSHMCGIWDLPRFLLRGSLTLMNMASLWSLWCPGTPHLCRSCQVWWNDLWWWHHDQYEKVALRCSLYVSPKVLPVCLIYSILHPRWSHMYL